MATRTHPAISALGLTVVVVVVLHLLAAALGLEPPPVPLDPEGHTAPFADAPFGI